MMNNDYQEAIRTLNTLLRFDEDAFEGYFLRGIAKYNLDDLLGAEADFSTAIRLESRLHAGLHLPRHHALAPGQLRRRPAGLPRGDRAAPRPARPLLQPRRDAPAEPAVQGGHRGFRQVHPPGEQGRRRLHLPGPELPPPEGHRARLRELQHGDPHQPRESQRLQPPRRRCYLQQEQLRGGRGRLQQGHRVRLDLPALVLQPRAGLLRHQPPDAGARGFRQGDLSSTRPIR